MHCPDLGTEPTGGLWPHRHGQGEQLALARAAGLSRPSHQLAGMELGSVWQGEGTGGPASVPCGQSCSSSALCVLRATAGHASAKQAWGVPTKGCAYQGAF